MSRRRVQACVLLLIFLGAASLIVPGINRVRDAANRTKCQNNLKQLALAVHNYNDAYQGKLPPLVDQGQNARTGQGLHSIFAILTPYIEAHATHYQWSRSPPADYYAHSSVVYTFDWKGETLTRNGGFANEFWPTLTDPADVTAQRLLDVPMTLPDGATGYYATGSYAANGLIPWGSGGIPRSFPAGTAKKILFAERPQVCRTADGDAVYNLWGLGFYSPHMPAFAALTPSEPPGLESSGQIAPVQPLPAVKADLESGIRVRIGRREAVPQAPDFRTPVQILRGARCDPRLPGSPHRGGMQVAMADGSVREFAPNVAPWVFWTACAPGWFPAMGEEDW
jgi:prepilin-type processing-associated H-X9-DG protein